MNQYLRFILLVFIVLSCAVSYCYVNVGQYKAELEMIAAFGDECLKIEQFRKKGGR
jgi:hypothetical protein